MRPVTAHLFSSLDGVVSAPHEFQFDSFGPEEGEAMVASTAGARDAVMGRRIYEEWAGWWPVHPDPEDFGGIINPMRKHVASRTLSGDLEWENSTLIGGDLLEEVRELRGGDAADGPVLVFGISVIRQLLAAGLLDELTLTVHPVLRGTGARLSDGLEEPLRLTLLRGATTSAGNAQLTYTTRTTPEPEDGRE